jgi:hypothetical protein
MANKLRTHGSQEMTGLINTECYTGIMPWRLRTLLANPALWDPARLCRYIPPAMSRICNKFRTEDADL